MATSAQVHSFIKLIAPLAQAQYLAGKKIHPSVSIAQACCESGYGTSPKMVRANAVYGIKVGKSGAHFGKAWKGRAYSTKTKECYDGKNLIEIVDMFRAYDSIAESVEDYYDMLCSCSRYRAAVNAPTWLDCITAIKNGGYATDPNYIKTISSIIKKYNLMKYDNVVSNADILVQNPYTEPTSSVSKGSTGSKVKWVQWELNQLGYELAVDGIAGKLTTAAIIDFQSKHGLAVDGIVGKFTRAELKAV